MQFAYALLLPLSIYAGATTLADLQLSGKVLVLAAASTTDAVDQTQQVYQAANPGVTLRVSYGSSSALAKQIAAGAKADIFLAASSDWADYLDKKQLIAERYELLENRLVIVVPDASKLSIEKIDDLTQAGVGHLAARRPRFRTGGHLRQAGIIEVKTLGSIERQDRICGRRAASPEVCRDWRGRRRNCLLHRRCSKPASANRSKNRPWP